MIEGSLSDFSDTMYYASEPTFTLSSDVTPDYSVNQERLVQESFIEIVAPQIQYLNGLYVNKSEDEQGVTMVDIRIEAVDDQTSFKVFEEELDPLSLILVARKEITLE